MLSHLDEIIAFADIGEFIDQPVKLYSSGMFVRLAFSVAAGVEADILLIDEALAVGDIFFRQKCYQRLEALRKKGVAIILVSHSMNEVEQFCERAMILDKGMVFFQGTAIEAVKRYYFLDRLNVSPIENRTLTDVSLPKEIQSSDEPIDWPSPNSFLKLNNLTQVTEGKAKCTAVTICDTQGNPCSIFQQGETASFFYEFTVYQDIEIPIGGVEIINEKGLIVHGKNSLQYNPHIPVKITQGQHIRFRQDMQLNVAVGEYTFNVGFSTIDSQTFFLRDKISHPDLIARIPVLCILPNAGAFAVIHRHSGKPTQLLHYGIADLPGQCSITVVPD
jgi:energy-coupling factor transporter ATP-binding protein EcfA2